MIGEYILCFLTGATVALTAAFLSRGSFMQKEEQEISSKESYHENKLQEQWRNLLNYDGSEQNGGL